MEQLSATNPPHRIDETTFDRLARGHGDRYTTEQLHRTCTSRTTLLVLGMAAAWPDLRPAIELISEAQSVDPRTVAHLLAHPWVSVWAAHCAGVGQARERRHMNAVALAAAARAGLGDARLDLFPVDGTIVVPSLGRLVHAGEKPLRLSPSDLDGANWQPIRTISAEHDGVRLTVSIDDVDGYRSHHGPPVTDRLEPSQLAALERTLEQAWRLLVDLTPQRAAELAAGLCSIVPLAASDDGALLSVSHQQAFGGFAMTVHGVAEQLAATMVHEFQHSKLSALHALVPLYRHDPVRLYFAPWRHDPRPLGGLLQGTYAFTAVAEFWRDLRTNEALRDGATVQFAFVRAQVARALHALSTAEDLTTAGRQLVAGLGEVIAEMSRVDIPADLRADAEAGVRVAEEAWLNRR